MKKLSIAIVGAGTAGLASAALLARDGHRVTVFEKNESIDPVGAGLLLQPTGLSVLHELGVFDECTRLGAPVKRLYGTVGNGVTILDTRYDDWQTDAHGLGIHRSVLIQSLLDAVAREGVVLRLGVDISRYDQDELGVTLFEAKRALGRFEVLILSDGTRSCLRQQMNVKQTVSPYPWGALWAIVPTPPAWQNHTDLRQWYKRSEQMFGLMPTGRTHDDPKPMTSLFWSLPVSQIDAWRGLGLDVWKNQVMALTPEAASFLAQITDVQQLAFAQYSDVTMKQWHDKRVVAIGDCAHAMSPQLGQGANMALVDALVLQRAFASAPDIEAALADYQKNRKSHLNHYRQASRLLTPLFQSHSKVAAPLRNRFLKMAARSHLGRRQGVHMLIGAKTGWLCGKLPNEALKVWRAEAASLKNIELETVQDA